MNNPSGKPATIYYTRYSIEPVKPPKAKAESWAKTQRRLPPWQRQGRRYE